jgi:hypothetical protein
MEEWQHRSWERRSTTYGRGGDDGAFWSSRLWRGGFCGGTFSELTFSGSSVKKRRPANKKRTRHRNRVQYPEDNQFNKLMNMMIERNTMQQREEESKESKELKETMKVTQLMSAFKEAKEAMGCLIKAFATVL